MRTKTLLLGTALAAVVATSAVAQSNVYSLNVVGYVNKPLVGGQFALLSNPLDDGTNRLTSLLPTAPNNSQVQLWSAGYAVANKSFGNWNTNLLIPPGTGFFLKVPAAQTNTFVGQVIVGPGQTNSSALPGGVFSLVGSPVPYAGVLTDSGINTLNLQLGNGSQIQMWTGTNYAVANKSFGNWNNNFAIEVGQGFFVKPNAATNWVQALPAN